MILQIRRIGNEGKVVRQFIEADNVEFFGEILMPEQKNALMRHGNTVLSYDMYSQLGKRKILKELRRLVGFKCEIELKYGNHEEVVNEDINTENIAVIVKRLPKWMILITATKYKLLNDGEPIDDWLKSEHSLKDVQGVVESWGIKDYELREGEIKW